MSARTKQLLFCMLLFAAAADPLWAEAGLCATEQNTIRYGVGSSSSILASDSGLISDLDVSLIIQHEYVGDIKITLSHIDTGTTVELINQPGKPQSENGCNGDDIVATLDDDGVKLVENECGKLPTIHGVFRPNEPLSGFNGEHLQGTWTINIEDIAEADDGALMQWCLIPTVNSSSIPGDLDRDNDVDFSDLFLFETMFNSQDMAGDFDHDGDVDFSDLYIFETWFNDFNRAKKS